MRSSSPCRTCCLLISSACLSHDPLRPPASAVSPISNLRHAFGPPCLAMLHVLCAGCEVARRAARNANARRRLLFWARETLWQFLYYCVGTVSRPVDGDDDKHKDSHGKWKPPMHAVFKVSFHRARPLSASAKYSPSASYASCTWLCRRVASPRHGPRT